MTGAPKGFAGLAIGLTLTLIHLISIPISNTSVNPARSTGVAFFNGDGAPAQLWVFWLAPLVGAAIAGIAYPYPVRRATRNSPTGRCATTRWRTRRDQTRSERTGLTGCLLGFGLLRAAALLGRRARRLASCPPEFSRCARTNHWNFSSSPT